MAHLLFLDDTCGRGLLSAPAPVGEADEESALVLEPTPAENTLASLVWELTESLRETSGVGALDATDTDALHVGEGLTAGSHLLK